jgi:Domain of unknown function (DUF4352)
MRCLGRAVGISLALGIALAGCADAPVAAPEPAVYPLAPRPVRPQEKPLVPAPTPEGDTVFELIGLTTGMPSVLGHHAEMPAKGQFVRVRLVVSNTGRNSIPFDANRQLLLTSTGTEHAPDSQAMLIKRQPSRIDIGSANRFEFDLYYDIPKDATPTALRAFGGPSLADFSDLTGVDIRIDTGES